MSGLHSERAQFGPRATAPVLILASDSDAISREAGRHAHTPSGIRFGGSAQRITSQRWMTAEVCVCVGPLFTHLHKCKIPHLHYWPNTTSSLHSTASKALMLTASSSFVLFFVLFVCLLSSLRACPRRPLMGLARTCELSLSSPQTA